MAIKDEDFDDARVVIAALAYYFYRLAGCPMGESLSGFQAWLNINILKPFEDLKNVNSDHG